jgi:NAD-dependent SIR2 family protein deacetylase
MPANSKTVYVLGAGFSMDAGAPSQAGVMDRIWKLTSPQTAVKKKERLKKFLENVLNVDPGKVSLEDIYTPIDRCLTDGAALRGASEAEVIQIRNELEYLIARVIQHAVASKGTTAANYIDEFARHLVGRCSKRADLAVDTMSSLAAKKHDPASVISLNWDTLLDGAIDRQLKIRHPKIKNDYGPFGSVDYCCYVSSFKRNDRRVRAGLWSLACRGYNVKLLKLHGSLNWLQCPNCQRLYVGFHRSTMFGYFSQDKKCRHCFDLGYDVNWQRAMVMPTFLKDLSNFQIKLIWQNAGIELLEAQRVVFVGYSLPMADFEFRQLISRMIHKDAKIEVYLLKGTKDFGPAKQRYKDFFSRHKPKIFGGGAKQFVSSL